MALISALYSIPYGVAYVTAYFGTPFFTLFSCICWCFSFKLLNNSNSNRLCLLFSISGLISALIRPEGVILFALILISTVLYIGFNHSKKIIISSIIIFGIPGAIYFFWRWVYFGYPFPNPYYKKVALGYWVRNLRIAYMNGIELLFPFLIVIFLIVIAVLLYPFGFGTNIIYKRFIFASIPIVGFLSIWLFVSSDLNYLARYQYPILPIFLILWPFMLKTIHEEWNRPRIPNFLTLSLKKRILVIFIIVSFCSITLIYQFGFRSQQISIRYRDGRYDMARMLNQYYEKNYTIATTEAGLLPLYSEWTAIDTEGLNDKWIVHNGIITKEYLDRYKPEIIMFYAFFSPINKPPPMNITLYDRKSMVMVLYNYAEENDYTLAASFGISPNATHYYYVLKNFSDSAEIISNIRNMNYYWIGNGQLCINYAI